jgi:small GTP-binding protein
MGGVPVVDAKVILVGDASVGKTSMIQQFNTRIFDEESEATIGASFVSKIVETPNGPVHIHIWDTAGQERYRSLIPLYSRNAGAAILVVDIANFSSFEHRDMWASIVREGCPPDCHVYVAANKMDLAPVVPINDLEHWCKENTYPFFRTTAKEYRTVADLFETIARDVASTAKPISGVEPHVPRPQTDDPGCC